MKRGKYENLFKRRCLFSTQSAERLANMTAKSKADVLRMLADDDDIREMIFQQAKQAGCIESDGCGGWVGRDTAARQSAAADWEP